MDPPKYSVPGSGNSSSEEDSRKQTVYEMIEYLAGKVWDGLKLSKCGYHIAAQRRK
jgi:hypothetical protein